MLKFVPMKDYKGRFEAMTLENEQGDTLWTCYGLPEAIEQAQAVAQLLAKLGFEVDTSEVREDYYYS